MPRETAEPLRTGRTLAVKYINKMIVVTAEFKNKPTRAKHIGKAAHSNGAKSKKGIPYMQQCVYLYMQQALWPIQEQ